MRGIYSLASIIPTVRDRLLELEQTIERFREKARWFVSSSTVVPAPIADAFATLYLPLNASLEDIRTARRLMARQHHPDVGGATEQMQHINAAADLCEAWLSQAGRR